MRGTQAGGWVTGAVVLVLAILAVTWFFLASPRLESAAATMLEAENARAQNDLLAVKNAQLRSDFESLEEYRAEVAALRVQIPAEAHLPAYVREVDGIAADTGVFVLEVSPGVATIFTVPAPPVPVAPAPTAPDESSDPDVSTESETGTIADADLADPANAPMAPTAPDGLVAVPFTIKVIGSYANTAAFLASLQTGAERLFLVTSVDATRQQEAEATPSKPAIADGDVEMSISGYTYVLRTPAVVPAPVPADSEEPAAPAPVPLPTSDRNPFAPLG